MYEINNIIIIIIIMVFIIDLEKAYDRVTRPDVWRRKREMEGPDKYVIIIPHMYEGARTRAKPIIGSGD